MKRIKLPVLLVIVLMTACHVFLGPDPDNSPKGIFDSIWNDFNETYALFDVKGVNWAEKRRIYSPRIQPDMNSFRLFRVCAEMLDELNDAHVALITPFGNPPAQESFNNEYIRNMLNDGGVFTGDKMFLYGTFREKPNVGYINIASFISGKQELSGGPIQDWAKRIDGIVKFLAHTDYIILDIRGNNGGLSSNAEYIAGRFISVQKDYIKVCTKNGPGRNDFSVPLSYTIKPAGSKYTKPVVLLTDNLTTSVAERFTLALRTQDHVTHAGETTRGALSLKIIRPLINGWEYTMSVQKVADMKGNYYEGTGIAPDFPITGYEAQLDYALNKFNIELHELHE